MVTVRQPCAESRTEALLSRLLQPRIMPALFYPPKSPSSAFGFLEVGGIKALRKPAIDRREQLLGFRTLALLLPQAAQAHGGP